MDLCTIFTKTFKFQLNTFNKFNHNILLAFYIILKLISFKDAAHLVIP